MGNFTMAELLAKQTTTNRQLSLSRGQEIEGRVLSILSQEIILDFGTKAEGVLQKKELRKEELENLKVGDKLSVFIVSTESESGQIILSLQKPQMRIGRSLVNSKEQQRFKRFETAKQKGEVLIGKGVEVNKGGLIVEVNGVRGFLPSSQVTLSQVSKLEELIGKELSLSVIEVEASQNRLIFSQKTNVSEAIKSELNKIKIGDIVDAEVAAMLPFGILVSLSEGELGSSSGIEGLVHISEVSWDKQEDSINAFKIGDKISAKVVSLDLSSGRVNLSIKELIKDPFDEISKKFEPDDVIKGKITKITSMGIFLELENGIEGLIHISKVDPNKYHIDQEISCLVDNVDQQRRRVNLVPFIMTTKDLIYK